MKLLMHACCAPCSVYCIKELRNENIEPTIFWYNPNIHPYTEYKARRDCLKEYCKKINVNLEIKDEYGLDEFCKNIFLENNTSRSKNGMQNQDENILQNENVIRSKDDVQIRNKNQKSDLDIARDNFNINLDARCVNYCYPKRLRQTFEFAKRNGYDAVTTTLLYSIYQKHDFIKTYCEKLSKEYGIEFLYRDFRKGFWEGHDGAIEAGLYMQKYCGCIFSEEQMILAHTNEKPVLPEGFEFLPVKRSIVIKKEKENKEQYMDLLLEADPSKDMINDYLRDGELFVLTYKDDVACVAVVIRIDDETIELKNIATKEIYRGQGYGKKMLKYLADNYKQKYKKMLVGTSENNIPFYVKQGFDKYEKTIKNYFVDNYDKEK